MLDWALRYARLGWPVIPLKGKIPLVERGSKDATTDEATIRQWWTQWPRANIGVITGQRFFAIDIDIKEGGDEEWERLQQGALTTLEQVTGTGGRHILFALPDFAVQNSAGKIAPGIDVRGVGGYIVAAPSVHPETNRHYEWDGLKEIEHQPLAQAPAWLLALLRTAQAPSGAAQQGKTLPEKIKAGTRDDTMFRTGCRLRRQGFTADEIFATLKVINANRCDPPLDDATVRKCAESAAKYEPDAKASAFVAQGGICSEEGTCLQVAKPAEGRPPGYSNLDLLSQPLTDSGNAERLIAMFGHNLRFCTEMKKWLVWDGRRWKVDDRRETAQLAKRVARALHAQVSADDGPRWKWARRSEFRTGIAAMLDCAETEPGVAIAANKLDQHPYLLNCLNGTIDLCTGELLPHDRGLLITKLCNLNYDPEATCPRFLKFLHWAMGQNEEADLSERTLHLMSYLQKVFGYALTGDVSEKCAFVFWGEKGNNGKTTLLDTFRTLLAEYSTQLSIDVLMANSGMNDSTMRADLADLRGVRLAMTSEVEKEHRLSVGVMKRITSGGGEIKSCRKYENPIIFPETHKLFMDCNHRPRVTDSNNAIWRRLKLVEFNVSMADDDPAMDKKLREKLVAEGPGILAFCVKGAMRWVKEGLEPPPEVMQAVEEWREHDDPLNDFTEECCELGDGRWVRTSKLYEAYVGWAQRMKQRYWLGQTEFKERLEQKSGIRYSHSRRDAEKKSLRTWEGIGLKDGVDGA